MSDRQGVSRWRPVVCVAALLLALAASAQQELTIEELEALIEQRKQELEAAEANRRQTREQVLEVRRQLDTQRQRQRELESELKMLCQERDTVTPGALADCVAEHLPQ